MLTRVSIPASVAMTAAMLASVAQPAAAQSGPRRMATATASARILTPLTITPGYELAFGLIKGGATAGSVTVRPEGVRVAGGGGEMVGSGPCQQVYCEDPTSPSNIESASYWGPGQFQVSGSPGFSYIVSAPSQVLAYLRVPAKDRLPTLVVSNFTFRALSTGTKNGALDAAGKDTIRVGATIAIPAGMLTGSYRVRAPISVQYN